MSADERRAPRCGFIGLGSQGAAMARRIAAAGYPLALWARRTEALEQFRDSGATFAASIAALGGEADHVGICVVNDADVREVCAELIPVMPRGGLIVIHSTVHPDTCRALAAEGATRGLFVIDAPVSGGGPAAEAGTLTVMVGGEAHAVALARPVLESFARLILHLGDVGAGQNAKLVNNSLMAANMALAHAAMTAGQALGIDRAALTALLKAGSGHSFALDVYARLPDPAAFEHGAALLAKDVGLLGNVLKEHAAVRALGDAAAPFLALSRNWAASQKPLNDGLQTNQPFLR